VFQGFPKDGPTFLKELTANNTKDWFAGNKKRFKSQLEGPAKEFVEAVESELPGPDWNSKIFRIHRDLRFSKDKTPYNTHLRIGFFSEGRASLFFSLEAATLILGSGVFEMSKDSLERYRQAVLSKAGEELETLLAEYKAQGYRLDDPELKRVPRGYDADHSRAELLKRKSLAIWLDKPIPEEIHSPKAVSHCLQIFQDMVRFRTWLECVF
jgi:uncharacterized protein (TIGR02453 family)